jgi:hypothetical protein
VHTFVNAILNYSRVFCNCCRVIGILNYTKRYFILMKYSKGGLAISVIGIAAVLILVVAPIAVNHQSFGNQAIVSVARATALPIQGAINPSPNGAVVGVTSNPNAITFGKSNFPNVTAITIPSTSKSSSGPSSSSASSSPISSSSASSSPNSPISSSSGPSSHSSMHVTHVTMHHKKHKGGHSGPSGSSSSGGPSSSSGY